MLRLLSCCVLLLAAAGSSQAADPLVARCDACNPSGYRNAALAAAASARDDATVYVFDNAAMHVEKVWLQVTSEPGTNIVRALSVPVEPEMRDFANAYWATEAELKQISVPAEVAPTLPEFISNGFAFGQTRSFVQSRVEQILTSEFAGISVANLTPVVQQALARLGAVQALGTGNFVATLSFQDGGSIDVEFNLMLRVSPATVGIYEFEIIDDTGQLNGRFFPNRRESLRDFRPGNHLDEDYILSILDQAQRWGIPVNCTPGVEIISVTCDHRGCHGRIRTTHCP